MKLALAQAAKSLQRDDFPVGAILAINGRIIDKARNTRHSKKNWGSHAETVLLIKNSALIARQQEQDKSTDVQLYTTLEPCLMCLGGAFLHRVDRIIFGCPDPRGGALGLQKKGLPSFYKDHWPKITGGVLREESYDMLMKFMVKKDTVQWRKNVKLFEAMKKSR